jgi:hypothetical protein
MAFGPTINLGNGRERHLPFPTLAEVQGARCGVPKTVLCQTEQNRLKVFAEALLGLTMGTLNVKEWSMPKIAFAVMSWAASAFCQTPANEPHWMEAESAHYSILYQSGFENDVKFARTWMNHAEDLLRNKYGVPFSGFYISFYLYPAPTQYANTGLANLQCCSNGNDGVKTGTISYLAPSAPAWREAPGPTSLGLPKDDNYPSSAESVG